MDAADTVRAMSIETIPGIEPAIAAAIAATLNVRTIADLARLDRRQIDALADLRVTAGLRRTGVEVPPLGRPRVQAWVAAARLRQLPTVSSEQADLLAAAGILSIEHLAAQSVDALHRKIVDLRKWTAETTGRPAPASPGQPMLSTLIMLARDATAVRRPAAPRPGWLAGAIGAMVRRLRSRP